MAKPVSRAGFVVFAFGLLGACQGSSIPDAPDLEADVESDAAIADLAMPSDTSDPPEVDGSADAQLADTPDAASELDAESDAALDIPIPCACDDQNACTDDTCDPATGVCSHTNLADGAPCQWANGCTLGGICKAGACIAGPVAGPPKLWAKAFGGNALDRATALVALSDGFAFAGLTKSSNLPDGQKTAGGWDGWLVRTDSSGELLWNKTFGATGDEGVVALVALTEGFAFAGYTTSTDLAGGPKNAGQSDFWLVRTDGTGNMLWNKTFGGSLDEKATSIVVLADGFAIAGVANSPDLPGDQQSFGQQDFWLVRTDVMGKLLWSKTFGGTGDEVALGLTALASGFALSGYTASTDLPNGQKTAGSNDLWLVRTDSTGKLLWNKTYGGSGVDQGYALVALSDGFAIAGATQSFDLPGGQASAGNWDAWFVRTDNSGNLLWNKTLGTGVGDSVYTVAELPDGFAFAGVTHSNGLPNGQSSNGIEDFWLVRTDSTGNLVWNKTFGSSAGEVLYAAVALTDGFAVAGHAGAYDNYHAWLVRTDAWGNATCADSGACVTKSVATCSDLNPCTADLCDAAHNGCWHQNLANGSPCGSGKTCNSGSCQ